MGTCWLESPSPELQRPQVREMGNQSTRDHEQMLKHILQSKENLTALSGKALDRGVHCSAVHWERSTVAPLYTNTSKDHLFSPLLVVFLNNYLHSTDLVSPLGDHNNLCSADSCVIFKFIVVQWCASVVLMCTKTTLTMPRDTLGHYRGLLLASCKESPKLLSTLTQCPPQEHSDCS